jgi:hypothetical protein
MNKVRDKENLTKLVKILQDSFKENTYSLIPTIILIKNATSLALNVKDNSGTLDLIIAELETREITPIPDDEVLDGDETPNPESVPAGTLLNQLVILLNKGVDHRVDQEKSLSELNEQNDISIGTRRKRN